MGKIKRGGGSFATESRSNRLGRAARLANSTVVRDMPGPAGFVADNAPERSASFICATPSYQATMTLRLADAAPSDRPRWRPLRAASATHGIVRAEAPQTTHEATQQRSRASSAGFSSRRNKRLRESLKVEGDGDREGPLVGPPQPTANSVFPKFVGVKASCSRADPAAPASRPQAGRRCSRPRRPPAARVGTRVRSCDSGDGRS